MYLSSSFQSTIKTREALLIQKLNRKNRIAASALWDTWHLHEDSPSVVPVGWLCRRFPQGKKTALRQRRAGREQPGQLSSCAAGSHLRSTEGQRQGGRQCVIKTACGLSVTRAAVRWYWPGIQNVPPLTNKGMAHWRPKGNGTNPVNTNFKQFCGKLQ